MLRLFKTVLLYLLMLAIPAQGFAASTMLFCGPSHQRMVSAQDSARHAAHGHSGALTLVADHQDHTPSADSMDSLGHASAHEVAAPHDSDSGPGKTGDIAKFKCSACAACCVSAAITASDLKLPLANQAFEPIASRPIPYVGFLTDGPRRPPRTFLA